MDGGTVAAALLASVLAGSTGTGPGDLHTWEVMPGASQVYIVTHRAGLLSFLGHEHAIVPGEWSARLCLARPIPEGAHGSLVVRTGSLVIDSDSARALAGLGGGPGLEDRQEVQGKMLDSLHLDADRFPEIRLELRAAGAAVDGRFTARGTVTLRGVTRDVELPVTVDDGEGERGGIRLSGTLRIRQRDFGIEPESVGGLVKVSNDVDLHFALAAVPSEEVCGADVPGGAFRARDRAGRPG
ncbi:MAG TPA: YceI family protein [Longimicrobiales bacterium]|jgi:hypothetical protein